MKKFISTILIFSTALFMFGCSKTVEKKKENVNIVSEDETENETDPADAESSSSFTREAFDGIAETIGAEKTDYKGILDKTRLNGAEEKISFSDAGEEAKKYSGGVLNSFQISVSGAKEAAVIYDGTIGDPGYHVKLSFFRFENEDDASNVFSKIDPNGEVGTKGNISYKFELIEYQENEIHPFAIYLDGDCIVMINGVTTAEEPELIGMLCKELKVPSPYDA